MNDLEERVLMLPHMIADAPKYVQEAYKQMQVEKNPRKRHQLKLILWPFLYGSKTALSHLANKKQHE